MPPKTLPLLLLFLPTLHLQAQTTPIACSKCAEWNTPQKSFRIYGNTYYVGTHGLGSILVTSPTGDILIDGALPQSVPLITANIQALGFKLKDIKVILNTHAHFDHAGGLAELQKLTGARVAASEWSAAVMKKGEVPKDDPQFGSISPIAPIARVETFKDGATLTAGSLTLTAHLTPGHTSGGTTWTWRSCENNRCLNLIYADSLTPAAADGFLFTRSKEYPTALADFARSFAFLDAAPCDILITPHPDISNLWQRLDQRASKPDALIDPKACHSLAERSRDALNQRIATESGK